MEIYRFEYGPLLRIILAAAAVGMAVAAGLVIRLAARRTRNGRGNRTGIPRGQGLAILPFVLVPLAFSVAFGCFFIRYTAWDVRMANGDASVLTGDVTVISAEAEYYRGSPSGYTVVIEVDGRRLAPANTFPADVLDALEGDGVLTVRYGEIPGDGVYVWSIHRAE